MTKKYVTIAFAAELANQQKEQVFNLLLGSRLVAGGVHLGHTEP